MHLASSPPLTLSSPCLQHFNFLVLNVRVAPCLSAFSHFSSLARSLARACARTRAHSVSQHSLSCLHSITLSFICSLFVPCSLVHSPSRAPSRALSRAPSRALSFSFAHQSSLALPLLSLLPLRAYTKSHVFIIAFHLLVLRRLLPGSLHVICSCTLYGDTGRCHYDCHYDCTLYTTVYSCWCS